MADDSELPEHRIADVLRDRHATDPAALRAMQNMLESEMPVFPENIFLKYLLPISYKPSTVTDDDDGDTYDRASITEWRRIVGSLSVDLRITDNSGETLFICPALFCETVTMADRTGQSMRWAELANESIRDNAIHPGLGQERLIAYGLPSLPTITDEEAAAHYARWVKVWERYGVNNRDQVDLDQPASAAVRSNAESVELEDEDEL